MTAPDTAAPRSDFTIDELAWAPWVVPVPPTP